MYQESFFKLLLFSLPRLWKTTVEKSINDRIKKRRRSLKKFLNHFNDIPVAKEEFIDYTAKDIQWLTRRKQHQTRLMHSFIYSHKTYSSSFLPTEKALQSHQETKENLIQRKQEFLKKAETLSTLPEDEQQKLLTDYQSWKSEAEKAKQAFESQENTWSSKEEAWKKGQERLDRHIDLHIKELDHLPEKTIPHSLTQWKAKAKEAVIQEKERWEQQKEAFSKLFLERKNQWVSLNLKIEDYTSLLESISDFESIKKST